MTLYNLASQLHGGFQHMLLVHVVPGLPRFKGRRWIPPLSISIKKIIKEFSDKF